jgi:hypothetical protein
MGKRLGTAGIIGLVLIVLIVVVQVIGLALPARSDPSVGGDLSALPVRPTRTATPTASLSATPVPPTATPAPSATPLPATATDLPPSPTPTATLAATETPAPTATPPAPAATSTPIPPTAVPAPPATAAPTATPVPTAAPLSLLTRVEVNNGEWGTNHIYVRYDNPEGDEISDLRVKASDGHTYRAEMGFLSRSQSVSQVQAHWGYAQRGGANWRGFVRLYDSVNWMTCSAEANVCYEIDEDPAQAAITSQVYIKPHVLESLANDYLSGGIEATTRNPHYWEIQNAIFRPIIDIAPPSAPCVGFQFVRVS